MNKVLILSTADDLLALGSRLAQATMKGTVIFLQGPLGAGKTTFARGFLQGVGYRGKVKSPTYTLVEPYETTQYAIFHFDLYRLTTAAALKDIGLQDYFSASTICLIEWPENGQPFLPSPDLACYIDFAPTGRHLCFQPHSAQGSQIFQHLMV